MHKKWTVNHTDIKPPVKTATDYCLASNSTDQLNKMTRKHISLIIYQTDIDIYDGQQIRKPKLGIR